MELTVMELRLGICTKALVHAGSTALSSSPRSDPLGGNPFRFQFQWFDLYLWLRCVFLNVYVYLNLGNTIWSIDWQPESLQKSHVISLSLSHMSTSSNDQHCFETPSDFLICWGFSDSWTFWRSSLCKKLRMWAHQGRNLCWGLAEDDYSRLW